MNNVCLETYAMKAVLDSYFQASIPTKDIVISGLRELSLEAGESTVLTGTVHYNDNDYFISASFAAQDMVNDPVELVISKMEPISSSTTIEL